MSGVNVVGSAYLNVNSTAMYIFAGSTGSTGSTGGLGLPERAKGLRMRAQNAGVRLWLDGTVPTTSVNGGELVSSSGVFVLDSWTPPGNNWRSVMLNTRVMSTGDGSTSNLTIHFFD